jgi:hypothetical protein
MAIVAQCVCGKMWHDRLEEARGALLDGPQDAAQDAAGEAAPRAIVPPGLAFERFVPFDVTRAQWTEGKTGALSPTPPASLGQGTAPYDSFIFIPFHDRAGYRFGEPTRSRVRDRSMEHTESRAGRGLARQGDESVVRVRRGLGAGALGAGTYAASPSWTGGPRASLAPGGARRQDSHRVRRRRGAPSPRQVPYQRAMTAVWSVVPRWRRRNGLPNRRGPPQTPRLLTSTTWPAGLRPWTPWASTRAGGATSRGCGLRLTCPRRRRSTPPTPCSHGAV